MDSEAGEVHPLGDLVTLQRGTTYKSSLLGEPGPVLLGLATIQRNGGFRDDSLRTYGGESPAKLILGPGDLYVSLKDVTQAGDLLGAVSRVPRTVEAGRLTQDTVRLDVIDGATDSRYLDWLLRTPQYRSYCRARAIGTTNLSLAREDFLAFAVPPLTTGRLSLVMALEAIDARIELNRRMNHTLESITRTIFKSWFIDFDPVRKKTMSGELELPPGLAALIPDRLEASAIGQMPVGWDVRSLGSLVSLESDRIDADAVDGELRYIALDDMPSKSVCLSSWRSAAEVTSSIIAFRAGDILFGSMRPYFHKVGLAPFDGITRTTTFVLRPTDDSLRHFALMHLSSDEVVDHATTCSVGTTIPYVRWEALASYRVAVPSPDLLKAYEGLISPLSERMSVNGRMAVSLREARDALLPHLMTGHTLATVS